MTLHLQLSVELDVSERIHSHTKKVHTEAQEMECLLRRTMAKNSSSSSNIVK